MLFDIDLFMCKNTYLSESMRDGKENFSTISDNNAKTGQLISLKKNCITLSKICCFRIQSGQIFMSVKKREQKPLYQFQNTSIIFIYLSFRFLG